MEKIQGNSSTEIPFVGQTTLEIITFFNTTGCYLPILYQSKTLKIIMKESEGREGP